MLSRLLGVPMQAPTMNRPGLLPEARGSAIWDVGATGLGFTVNPKKLEHGFRRIGARIPYALP